MEHDIANGGWWYTEEYLYGRDRTMTEPLHVDDLDRAPPPRDAFEALTDGDLERWIAEWELLIQSGKYRFSGVPITAADMEEIYGELLEMQAELVRRKAAPVVVDCREDDGQPE